MPRLARFIKQIGQQELKIIYLIYGHSIFYCRSDHSLRLDDGYIIKAILEDSGLGSLDPEDTRSLLFYEIVTSQSGLRLENPGQYIV